MLDRTETVITSVLHYGSILSEGDLMSPGPKPVTITLTAQGRADIEAVTRQATSPQRDVFRAQIILLATNGYNNIEIAYKLGYGQKTARKWRGRFTDAGRAALTTEVCLGVMFLPCRRALQVVD